MQSHTYTYIKIDEFYTSQKEEQTLIQHNKIIQMCAHELDLEIFHSLTSKRHLAWNNTR